MELWINWMSLVNDFRAACSRQKTFFWLTAALMGFSIKFDSNGVTSLARGIGVMSCHYTSFLHLFYSSALDLAKLRQCWYQLVFSKFSSIIKINGRYILVGDGIKIGKEGKKMPGVKSLHQDSESNSKAEFIMGHSIQAVALLVQGLTSFFAVPLTAEIHEGFKVNCQDKRTLLDKMFEMLLNMNLPDAFYFVADKYYCSGKFFKAMVGAGNHVITMMKRKSVAYYPLEPAKLKTKGRPKKYGEKLKLFDLFKRKDIIFTTAPMPGNEQISIEYYVIELIWRPLGELVRFVLIKHPEKGNGIFLSTDLFLDPLKIIWIYSLRFKIEVTFKQAVHQIGAFLYHFWIKKMMPTKRGSKEQQLQFSPPAFKKKVFEKLNAYHLFIQLGLIAQGLMQYLSVTHPTTVWGKFGSWLRTVRNGIPPSEKIVSMALGRTFIEYMIDGSRDPTFKKFMHEKTNFGNNNVAGLERKEVA
jgi:hypothetical protein